MIIELMRQSVEIVNIALAVGTWALVAVSAFFMHRSAKEIAKSNTINKEAIDLTRLGLKSRLQPDINLVDFKGTLLSKREPVMRVEGKIKNTGTVSASNIQTPLGETEKEYLRDLVKEKSIISSSKSFGALTPATETEFMYDLPWTPTKERTKLAVWVEYDYVDIEKERGEKVFLLNVTGGGVVTMKQFVKADIEAARNEVQSS